MGDSFQRDQDNVAANLRACSCLMLVWRGICSDIGKAVVQTWRRYRPPLRQWAVSSQPRCCMAIAEKLRERSLRPCAAGNPASRANLGGKPSFGSAALHLRRTWESGHSCAAQRSPCHAARDGRRTGRLARRRSFFPEDYRDTPVLLGLKKQQASRGISATYGWQTVRKLIRAAILVTSHARQPRLQRG